MRRIALLLSIGMLSASAVAQTRLPDGQGPDAAARVLCRVKLVAPGEPDMTSVEDILASILKPGMTDEEKCVAIYRFVHEHRFWYPSAAARQNGRSVDDPVLQSNCYATLICQQDAAITGALWAAAGYDVRYWQLGGHTSGEVLWGGKWRNLDATFGRYRRDKDSEIGDVSVNQGSMYKPGKSYVPPYDDFDIGHRMDLTLRRGESFTRYWYPLGTAAEYWRPGGQKGIRPDDKKGQRRALETIVRKKEYRIDARGQGYVNGEWTFSPDYTDADWRTLFETVENVSVDAKSGTLRREDAARPATLVWRMRTPYVITGAWVECAVTGAPATLAVSTDEGASWKTLAPVNAGRQKVTLFEQVADEFSYLLKIAPGVDTRVSALKITTIVQANPLALPALVAGKNEVRLSQGEQVETLVIQPDFQTTDYRAQVFDETNLTTAREQLQPQWVSGICAKEGGRESTLVYKVTAPGDIRRARWGGRFRATADDENEMYYSLDGKTWTKQTLSDRWTCPRSETPNLYPAYWETTEGFPAGTRTVYLKYRFVRPVPKKEPTELNLATHVRMDVDYVPRAKTGSAPVEVTYAWVEGDEKNPVEKTHTEIARKLPHAYSITVGGEEKPLMKWVRLRVAAP